MSALFTQLTPAAVAALATFVAAWVFARIAPRVGWIDGGDRGHKLGVEPLPLCGGAAITCGLLAGWACMNVLGRERASFVPGRDLAAILSPLLWQGATLLPWGGVLVAFAIGLIDDLSPNGLRASAKLAGQALSGLALGLPLLVSAPTDSGAWLAVLVLIVGAVIAQNALNTFDNADGVATTLACAALAWPAPLFAAPLAAFLPFNLARPRKLPKSILGDAGSHVLGMLILLTPVAWPALALPLLDLLRLCVVRTKLAHKPWIGDRRHLAHRLARRVSSAPRVAALLLAAAIPSIVLGSCGVRGWIPGGVALGLLATAAAFTALTRWAPSVPEPLPLADAARIAALPSNVDANA